MAYIPRKPGRFVRETEGARPREATKDEAAKSRGTVVVAPKKSKET
ncbi:hypothetical protein [Oricola indica]